VSGKILERANTREQGRVRENEKDNIVLMKRE